MTFATMIYFIIPFVFFCLYTYLSNRKLPQEYNFKLVRRVYYLFVTAYLFLLLLLNQDSIKAISIIQIANFDKILLNNLLIIVLVILVAFIWENLFISCRTLKIIKLKDVELSFDEQKDLEINAKTQDKAINTYDAVLNAKIRMDKYVENYVTNTELDPSQSYCDILEEYAAQRKNIKIHIYYENDENIALMQKELKLKKDELSSIIYAIELFGYCKPDKFRNKDYIFGRIKTKYSEYNIIAVMISDFLVDNENLLLVDIINYFEMMITINILEIEKMQLEDLQTDKVLL